VREVTGRTRNRLTRAALIATLIALVSVAPAGSAPAAPVAAGPDAGAVLAFLPAFSWSGVSGADRYEFEISADSGFNSPVLGSTFDHFFTKNTHATINKSIPNGTYWWHVRSIGPDGSLSPWSSARSFQKLWLIAPTLTAPANGSTITYPTQAFRLSWNPVPGAFDYLLSVATDPELGSLVWSQAVETQATTFTLSLPLAPDKTYFWGVTALDPEGHPGGSSEVRSFNWVWPSTTNPTVTDIASALEIDDHEFSWNPVPGAAGYELEVNTSVDFAPGSKVPLASIPVDPITKLTTIATRFTPKVALQNNNHYYWRVRAIDPSKNAGVWNVGPQFSKGFDNVLPSIKNLQMLDNPTPNETFETDTPIVTWSPVPGASSYLVEVTKFAGGCQWTSNMERWRSFTAATTWTPLGNTWNGVKPWESERPVNTDTPGMVAGNSYCVRVTAIDRASDFPSPQIRSDVTDLPAAGTPAFTWTGSPAGEFCPTPEDQQHPCAALNAGHYLAPITGVVHRSMPLFRWKPLAGYGSYFVLVSKDPLFTNLVDYGFTKIPAYSPRSGFGPKTYPDETNEYFWAVLPASGTTGFGVTTAPTANAPQNFEKQSLPPIRLGPANGTVFVGPVTFRWSPAADARRYRLQVSQDPTFSSLIVEDVVTDSTSYTSLRTYPADVNLYWRVRADAETFEFTEGVGLTWSTTGTFIQTLLEPVVDPGNPTGGDSVPTWEWGHVPGSISYDLQVLRPTGGVPLQFLGIPSRAFTPTLMKGTGNWQWRVLANFPQTGPGNPTDGPWTPWFSFTRTIREPTNPSESTGPRGVALAWDAKAGARNYRVQISTRPDFTSIIDAQATDNPSFAPLLTHPAYAAGGTFYWHVAAADDVSLNVGDFSPTRSFTLAPTTTTTTTTTPPTTKASSSITLRVRKLTARIRARGTVMPNHSGRAVTVKLFRKRSGVWRRLSTKSVKLSSTSAYATSFSRPRPGYCKIVSRFPGDTDHRASSKTVAFRC
jgi:hypothetical protein